jgi:uncharacterized protein (TIRG00374 family)
VSYGSSNKFFGGATFGTGISANSCGVSAVTRWLRWIIVISISAVSVWAVTRMVVWKDLIESLEGMEFRYVFVALAFLLLSMVCRMERWRLLLHDSSQIQRKHLLAALVIGYLGITVLPFRLGELARGYAANRLTGVSVSDALTAIFVEHVFDLGTLLLLLLWQWPLLRSNEWIQPVYLIGSLVLAISISGILVVIVFSKTLIRYIQSLEERAPQLVSKFGIAQHIVTAISAVIRLRDTGLFLRLVVWSLVTWAFACAFNAAFLLALGINPVLEGAVLTILGTNLVSVMPSTPGYIGVYDLASVAALGILGVSSAEAVAFAVTSHFVLLSAFIVLGIVALGLTGMGWRSITVRSEEKSEV